MTIFGKGFLNVLIALHPTGRLALTRDERTEAWMLIGFLVALPVCLVISAVTPFKIWVSAAIAGFGVFLVSLFGMLETPGLARRIFVWTVFALLASGTVFAAIAQLVKGDAT
jgi:hypothetical protein